MPDIWYDVDTALAEVPVNILPLIDDTDFKAIEGAVAYNAAGLALRWHFVTCAGAYTVTSVTPTTGGNYDWTDQGDSGIYTIEIPASGGASINNDTEGFGWFTGVATGILPWRGPTIGFRAAALNDALIESAWSATRGLAGTALPAVAAGSADGLILGSAANKLAVDAAGKVAVPDTQKVDLNTVKTQAVTCAAGVTILASVGTAATATAQSRDLTDAVLATAIWNAATASYGSAGTYGLLVESANAIVADWTDGGRLDLLLDGVKAKTDGLNFTGTDVKATLDGEEVTPTAASKTGYTLTATTGLGNQTANINGSVASVTGAVGSVAAGGIASTSFAAGAINAAAIANGAIDAATFAADVDAEIAAMVWNAATSGYGGAGTYGQAAEDILADTNELQGNQGDWATATGFSTHSAADVAALILATPAQKLVTDASGHVTLANGAHGGAAASITLADYSDFQGAAGDPWDVTLPGAYAAGKAGYILGTNLDAVLSARTLASDDYFDPAADTVATVTTLTNLPAAPADWLTAAAVKADAVTKIQTGLATPTNITAGTITTVTNLTNAPTSGDLTATMKSSVTTAATAATPTVTLANGAHGGAAASLTLADYSAFKATGFSTHSANDVASLILATPANKLATDASGYVTFNNTSIGVSGTVQIDATTGWGGSALPTSFAVSDKTGFSLANGSIVTATFGTCVLPKSPMSLAAADVTGNLPADVIQWNSGALPTIGTSTLTAQQVWEYATRVLTANTNLGLPVSWPASWPANWSWSTLTAQQVWEYATRTLSAFSFTVAATGDWTTDADITQLKSDLATAHGSGSWATATGFELSGAAATAGASVVSSLSSAHGAGSWATATGFAVPGSAMTLTAAYDAAKTAAPANTALSSAVWTNTKAGYLDAAVSDAGGLDAAGVRAAIGMDAADLDAQLDAILTASTPVGGSFTQTVTVNASGGGAIPNAVVEILSGTSPSFVTIDRATTNSSGVAAPTANAGTYTLKVTATGYESHSEALVVTSHAVVPTITLTAISVPSEPDPAKTTAYWYVYGNDSELVGAGEVTMTIEIVELPADRGRAYDDTAISKSTTSGGLISASLFKGAKYKVILSDDREWVVEVPLTAGTTYRMPPIRVVST